MLMSPEDRGSLIPRTLVWTNKTTLTQCRIPCLNMHRCRNLKFYMVKTGCRVVGPCHHGMARPQVADRGTASNMEGSCE